MTRVFVTQIPMVKNKLTGQLEDQHDLTPAEDYGALHELLPPGQHNGDTAPVIKLLRDSLEQAGANENDFLLALGDPVLMCAATLVYAQRTNGVVQFLKWDRMQRVYTMFRVDVRV